MSYERDFKECVTLLTSIVEDGDPVGMFEKNRFALDNANKLLKQMEVEAMNFMDDDSIRKRVSFSSSRLHLCALTPSSSLPLDKQAQGRL